MECGKCPACNSEWGLKYDYTPVVEAGYLWYHASCPKCGWEGREVYNVDFVDFENADGTPLETPQTADN